MKAGRVPHRINQKLNFRNKNVLRAELKKICCIFNRIHNIGAEKEKARSPHVREFTVGTVKKSLEDKRRLRCGWYCCRRDDK